MHQATCALKWYLAAIISHCIACCVGRCLQYGWGLRSSQLNVFLQSRMKGLSFAVIWCITPRGQTSVRLPTTLSICSYWLPKRGSNRSSLHPKSCLWSSWGHLISCPRYESVGWHSAAESNLFWSEIAEGRTSVHFLQSVFWSQQWEQGFWWELRTGQDCLSEKSQMKTDWQAIARDWILNSSK